MNKSRTLAPSSRSPGVTDSNDYVLAWSEGGRMWSRDSMDNIDGTLTVDRHRGVLGEDSVRIVCDNPIPAEQMTRYNGVPAGGQMVSGDTSLFLAQDSEL